MENKLMKDKLVNKGLEEISNKKTIDGDNELTDDKKFEIVAKRVLNKYRRAFEKLSK